MKSVILLSLLLLTSSCSGSLVNPEDNDMPGSRNYTWTIDTLQKYAPYIFFTQIAGTSPQNIWLTGFGSPIGSVLHYDGSNFNIIETPPRFVGSSIYILNPNIVWVGSYKSEFWQIKGGVSQKLQNVKPSDSTEVVISNMIGRNESELFACGYELTNDDKKYGVLFKHDDKGWNYEYKSMLPNTQFAIIKSGSNTPGKYYILSAGINYGLDSLTLYQYDKKELLQIYRTFWNGNEIDPNVLTINNNLYFVFDRKIHEYYNNKFIVIKDLSHFNITTSQFWGRSFSDLFFTHNWQLGHYNGSDIKILFQLPFDSMISGALFFENDVYFLIYKQPFYDTYLIHGKLNK